MNRVTTERYIQSTGPDDHWIHGGAQARVQQAGEDLLPGRGGMDVVCEALSLALSEDAPKGRPEAKLVTVADPVRQSVLRVAVRAHDTSVVGRESSPFTFDYQRRSLRGGHVWVQVWGHETGCTIEAVVVADASFRMRHRRVAEAVDAALGVTGVGFSQLRALWNSKVSMDHGGRDVRYHNEVRDLLLNLAAG